MEARQRRLLIIVSPLCTFLLNIHGLYTQSTRDLPQMDEISPDVEIRNFDCICRTPGGDMICITDKLKTSISQRSLPQWATPSITQIILCNPSRTPEVFFTRECMFRNWETPFWEYRIEAFKATVLIGCQIDDVSMAVLNERSRAVRLEWTELMWHEPLAVL